MAAVDARKIYSFIYIYKMAKNANAVVRVCLDPFVIMLLAAAVYYFFIYRAPVQEGFFGGFRMPRLLGKSNEQKAARRFRGFGF